MYPARLIAILLIATGSVWASASENEQPLNETVASAEARTVPVAEREPGFPVKQMHGCAADDGGSNSATPTWDTPAATTPCGTVEVDSLFVRQSAAAGVHQASMVSTLRYGAASNLELRWGPPGRIYQSGGGPRLRGVTDTWVGMCYRFREQGRRTPDLALDYALKVPTANPAKGFGTGYFDHQFTFIASRDLGSTHLDFNAVGVLAGSAPGSDGAPQFGLAVSRPLTSRLLASIETYGGPQPGTDARYGAGFLGASWSVRPTLALNAGYTRAFTAGTPRDQVVVGFIYTLRLTPGRPQPR